MTDSCKTVLQDILDWVVLETEQGWKTTEIAALERWLSCILQITSTQTQPADEKDTIFAWQVRLAV